MSIELKPLPNLRDKRLFGDRINNRIKELRQSQWAAKRTSEAEFIQQGIDYLEQIESEMGNNPMVTHSQFIDIITHWGS